MAIPSINLNDRRELVYTGDPSFGSPISESARWLCRAATAHDHQIGASIYVIRPLSRPERREARLRAEDNFNEEMVQCGERGFCGAKGDPRPVPEQWDGLPDRVRISIGAAVHMLTGMPIDPFAQPSSG